MYDVWLDAKPMTWSIWDRVGWVGDITLDGDQWACENHGPFDTWQDAIAALVDVR